MQTFYSFGCRNNSIETHNNAYLYTNVIISSLKIAYFDKNVVLSRKQDKKLLIIAVFCGEGFLLWGFPNGLIINDQSLFLDLAFTLKFEKVSHLNLNRSNFIMILTIFTIVR